MDRSPGFASTACYLGALFRLAFAMPAPETGLSLQHAVTRWSIMQKVRRQASVCLRRRIALRPLVGLQFQVLFHSPPGVLFDFPSRYWFTFGQIRVFRLSPWSGQIPAEFPVPRSTWDASRAFEDFAYRTFTFCGVPSQTLLLSSPVPY